MKPASEIHAEVGKQISISDSGKYRAFTVSDIAKIIADAMAESKLQNEKLEFENIELNATINTLHNLCVSAEKRVLQKLKAESKGVCEWRRLHSAFVRHQSSCSAVYNNIEGNFCPGCGKEIKVV